MLALMFMLMLMLMLMWMVDFDGLLLALQVQLTRYFATAIVHAPY